jgi:hypothetical protein
LGLPDADVTRFRDEHPVPAKKLDRDTVTISDRSRINQAGSWTINRHIPAHRFSGLCAQASFLRRVCLRQGQLSPASFEAAGQDDSIRSKTFFVFRHVKTKESAMNKVLATAVVALVACFTALSLAEAPDEKLLAEMKKCTVCKTMAENPELLEQMTWETHKIENGMLCVASVPKQYAKEFATLYDKMMQSVAKVKADSQQGKTTALCSFCESMGELNKAGAKQQEIKTGTGAISLITSMDPEVVRKIHAHADKAIAEQKKLQQNRPTT